jgi:hypothetical protein
MDKSRNGIDLLKYRTERPFSKKKNAKKTNINFRNGTFQKKNAKKTNINFRNGTFQKLKVIQQCPDFRTWSKIALFLFTPYQKTGMLHF